MTDNDVASIAAGLIPMEKERLLGWTGVAGAAYNVVSEDLCEAGLLNRDWSLSPLGVRVRNHLKGQSDG